VQLHSLVPVWNRVSPAVAEKAISTSAKEYRTGGGRNVGVVRQSIGVAASAFAANASVDRIQEKLKQLSFDHLVWIAPMSLKGKALRTRMKNSSRGSTKA
jgi:hypothetical protein